MKRTFEAPGDSLDQLKFGIDALVEQARDPVYTHIREDADGVEHKSEIVSLMNPTGLARVAEANAAHARSMLDGASMSPDTREFIGNVITAYGALPKIFDGCEDPGMSIHANEQGARRDEYITALGQMQKGIGHFVSSVRANSAA